MSHKLDIILIAFIASQLLCSAACQQDGSSECSPKVCQTVPKGYILVPNVGYYKFHTKATTWNHARNICIAEGGHLAILNSAEEEEALRDMYRDNNESVSDIGWIDAKRAWLGTHDQFKEDDWVTVLDQPLESIPYQPWIKHHAKCGTQPDNTLNQDCGALSLDCGKMDDVECGWSLPFICELTYDCNLSGIEPRITSQP